MLGTRSRDSLMLNDNRLTCFLRAGVPRLADLMDGMTWGSERAHAWPAPYASSKRSPRLSASLQIPVSKACSYRITIFLPSLPLATGQ